MDIYLIRVSGQRRCSSGGYYVEHCTVSLAFRGKFILQPLNSKKIFYILKVSLYDDDVINSDSNSEIVVSGNMTSNL